MGIKIKKISKTNEFAYTGDIEVADTNSYQLDNGAISHNSVLLKTASGIHGHHDYQYIRNVQMNKDSPVAKVIKRVYPEILEESRWSANKTDYIVSFPVVVNKSAVTKNELLGVKLLEKVVFVQKNWVDYGTNLELCVNKSVRHNVSNTVVVDDWDAVEKFIYANKNVLTGVSLLSMMGDKDYVQAPNTSVYYPINLNRMYGIGAMFGSGLIVDAIHAFGSLWTAADYVKFNTPIESDAPNRALMIDWIRRYKKFSQNYFKGDMTASEYCLKDINNLHHWMKLQKVLTEGRFKIDWENELHEQSMIEVDTLGATACAGGACEV